MKYQAIFLWLGLWKLAGFSNSFDILIWNLFKTLLGTLHNKKKTQRFNTTHSWPKEIHHLEKIPSLHVLQWDLSCFVMSQKWHVLKEIRIARDPWGILQRGFLRVTLRTIWHNVHDPGSGSVTQGCRKKWVQKSCVSFEEECSDKVTTDCDDHQLGRLEIHEKIENWK